jgi:N-methylhydantoinase A/oxoprolinase/acetone carboxylase beta subunit
MSIALGIDTGGTYTDAALVEYGTNRVLASAKALTTKHDLAIGIRQAVERVLQAKPSDVGLVSLSTTLATNAIVEGHGAPACTLLIGYQGRIEEQLDLRRQLGIEHHVMIGGGHLANGEEAEPLDELAARRAIRDYADRVSAFAISGFFGTRNPAHELAVRRLVTEMTGLPVTCGHELSHQLDAPKRATTAALNASLIPLICDLIQAVERIMREQGIQAPLMVVKGDGSLMRASMAQERPIETILSGPAASVVGAQTLAAAEESVIVDMGGTTSDIAVIHQGRPRLSPSGAQVGPWRTMVEAIDVHTVGLGGDSRVWLTADLQLHIGPRRVTPICLLASAYPQVRAALQAQLQRAKSHPTDGEFLLLQRDEPRREGDHPPFEQELLAELRQGPVSLERAHAIMRHPELYARFLETLERQRIIVRAGLTPTDAAHVLGEYGDWDAEAALEGATCLARRLGTEPVALCQRILRETSERIAQEVIVKLLADDGQDGHREPLQNVLVQRALRSAPEATLDCTLTLRPTLVALGAPVHTYFPDVARMLHCRLEIPEHTGVANAVGAVAGSVVQRIYVSVLPNGDEGNYRVHLPDEVAFFATLAESTAYGRRRGQALALEGARLAGAADIKVTVDELEHSAPVSEDFGNELYLGTDLTITAVGRPRLTAD